METPCSGSDIASTAADSGSCHRQWLQLCGGHDTTWKTAPFEEATTTVGLNGGSLPPRSDGVRWQAPLRVVSNHPPTAVAASGASRR